MSRRQSDLLKRQVLWLAVGLLAYIGAGLLLLFALFPAFSEQGLEMEAVGIEQMGAMVASLFLFVLGGYAARRMRGGLPRSAADDGYYQTQSGGGGRPEPQEESSEGEVLTCQNCGAANERFYTYCGECSAKL